MTSAPLLGAGGKLLSSRQPSAPIARAQLCPFPQLAGVVLVRIRSAQGAPPEAWRLILAQRMGIGPEGVALNLDLLRGAKGRDVAHTLRELARGLDAMVDAAEAAQAAVQASPDVQPTAEQPQAKA